MFRYSVFGSCLESELALPELRPATASADAAPTWSLRIATAGESESPRESPPLLGMDAVMDGVDVRLYRTASGYRLTYDDTGSFTISADGQRIVWHEGDRPWVEAARLDIINRVLPIALHAQGRLCLHGSAVCVGGSAVALLAPRGYGKSTLALALMSAGARILTDDALPVRPEPPVVAWPGVHSLRLFGETAEAVLGEEARVQELGAYPMPRRDLHQLDPTQPHITKQILRALADEQLQLDPVALAAVYVIVPVRANDGGVAAVRRPIPAVRAAVRLVEHTKSGVLLGKSAAPAVFERAVRVATRVPVFQLHVVRDLTRVGEVARRLIEWHEPATATVG